jgi:hypothetical protein
MTRTVGKYVTGQGGKVHYGTEYDGRLAELWCGAGWNARSGFGTVRRLPEAFKGPVTCLKCLAAVEDRDARA